MNKKYVTGVKIPKHESTEMEELVTKNLALRAHLLTVLDRNNELEQRVAQLERENTQLRATSRLPASSGDATTTSFEDFGTDVDDRCLSIRFNDLTMSSIRAPHFDNSSPQ